MAELAIQLDGLTKRFGSRTAVDGVTLNVPHGSVYGLVGPNGAGKTTLMRTMLGFTHASSGTSTVLGKSMPHNRASIYPRIGVIIEEPRFYPFLTGMENLQQIIAARPESISDDQVAKALAAVDMTARADDRVKTYSLGMRQRLGIARALLHDPEVLILDEPSNGLDPPGIRDMRLLLRSLADGGRTVFVSSHLLAEIELMCDHVAVLKDGKIIADGAVEELMRPSTDDGAAPVGLRVTVGVHDPALAKVKLDAIDGVTDVAMGLEPYTVLVTLAPGSGDEQIAGINAHLVGAGVGVHRLEPAAASLEQRFMEIIDGGGVG